MEPNLHRLGKRTYLQNRKKMTIPFKEGMTGFEKIMKNINKKSLYTLLPCIYKTEIIILVDSAWKVYEIKVFLR